MKSKSSTLVQKMPTNKPIQLMQYEKVIKSSFFVFLPLLFLMSTADAQVQSASDNKSLDQIVAVVNDHIILKSEVDESVRQYMFQLQQQNNRKPSFNKQIWYTVLQDMVQNFVLLDQAKIDSIEVTDTQVDQQIDQRLNQSVSQLGSEEALEERMGKSIVQIRADLREQYREDLIVRQYRQEKMRAVQITRPEVESFFENIPADSVPTIPEQVSLSQIVAIPPPVEDARNEARQLAEQLRDSVINHDKNIEELARAYSDGPSATDGGKIPMYPLDQLASEYSAAAAALEPGGISEVVETSFGFHVIRLNKRQGDQIDTNHILIKVDKENFNDEQAIETLNAFRDSLEANKKTTFADLARKKSEDPNTAPQGGRILNPQSGDRLLTIDQLDPALYRIVLLLDDQGDISEPKPFTIGSQNNSKRAYRIVRLDEHNPEHVANLEEDYDRIKNFALQEKQYKIVQKWINNLKNKVYIEYKIPMPKQLTEALN
jgi:peptidyl-prolyl cis-trans isomerase SurA